MRITNIEVDVVPRNCRDCIFYQLIDPDISWSGGFYECKLKIMMGYQQFGISLRPCPLDPVR